MYEKQFTELYNKYDGNYSDLVECIISYLVEKRLLKDFLEKKVIGGMM